MPVRLKKMFMCCCCTGSFKGKPSDSLQYLVYSLYKMCPLYLLNKSVRTFFIWLFFHVTDSLNGVGRKFIILDYLRRSEFFLRYISMRREQDNYALRFIEKNNNNTTFVPLSYYGVNGEIWGGVVSDCFAISVILSDWNFFHVHHKLLPFILPSTAHAATVGNIRNKMWFILFCVDVQ